MAENQPNSEVIKMYNKGNAAGMLSNFVEAFECYLSAADQGYAPAQCNLAYCYEKGHGVALNYQKALEYYQKAAKQDTRPI